MATKAEAPQATHEGLEWNRAEAFLSIGGIDSKKFLDTFRESCWDIFVEGELGEVGSRLMIVEEGMIRYFRVGRRVTFQVEQGFQDFRLDGGAKRIDASVEFVSAPTDGGELTASWGRKSIERVVVTTLGRKDGLSRQVRIATVVFNLEHGSKGIEEISFDLAKCEIKTGSFVDNLSRI